MKIETTTISIKGFVNKILELERKDVKLDDKWIMKYIDKFFMVEK